LGFPNRVVFNDRGTARPCLLPPAAVKSKPPAVRVVANSALLIAGNDEDDDIQTPNKASPPIGFQADPYGRIDLAHDHFDLGLF